MAIDKERAQRTREFMDQHGLRDYTEATMEQLKQKLAQKEKDQTPNTEQPPSPAS